MHRTLLNVALLGVALIDLAIVGYAQQPVVSVKQLMTASEFENAGLKKLTEEELKVLDKWFEKTLVAIAAKVGQAAAARGRASSSSPSAGMIPGTYVVEASVNDETFVINANVFKAKTYCFNVGKGDRVKFVEGSASGACASAKFVNMRTGDVCAVWCE